MKRTITLKGPYGGLPPVPAEIFGAFGVHHVFASEDPETFGPYAVSHVRSGLRAARLRRLAAARRLAKDLNALGGWDFDEAKDMAADTLAAGNRLVLAALEDEAVAKRAEEDKRYAKRRRA